MKFYRLHKSYDAGVSAGYEYFASVKVANVAHRAWLKDQPKEAEATQIEVIDIEPTKEGILRALNRFASHPDNG